MLVEVFYSLEILLDVVIYYFNSCVVAAEVVFEGCLIPEYYIIYVLEFLEDFFLNWFCVGYSSVKFVVFCAYWLWNC